MPNNPLEQSVNQATRDARRLGELFRAVGSSDYVDTPILRAYRAAYRSLRNALDAGHGVDAVTDTFAGLRSVITQETTEILEQAGVEGANSAKRQIKYYGQTFKGIPELAIVQKSRAARAPILAKLDQQEAAIMAMFETGPDPAVILGDESRVGVLRPSDILVTSAVWIAALFWSMFSYTVLDNSGATTFEKMAVAGLDERTTDCCLRVHGQVQPLTDKFKLTGTPRFADRIGWPPFHWYCRTSGVLYQAGFDDDISALMQQKARELLAKKQAGITPVIHPADAYSAG